MLPNASISSVENKLKIKQKINIFREKRKTQNNPNIVVVRRSNKVGQALTLPKILNINPRSAMNKVEELRTFIEEESIDCAFISESHETENRRLEDLISLDDYTVISNIY